ncbi:acetyltransferase (isoleucine patch superfamily) [Leptolyngbya sp. Heron Island J]|uniref:acyltransferase n=1 Tax=Leptolyngbya sp. Heron Island J TaxID=1385935 RepID=UPI0003B9A796|nr:acyltransferase [Leptolyngbya sp. Heron Island J]ESA35872.1 acetyltransferase (isoleucine patch superfamily) [Leptolyngbya sp. Heron Island J]
MISSPSQKRIEKIPLSEQLNQGSESALTRYQTKVLGDTRLLPFLKYELLTFLLSDLTGAIGYLLRKKFYPSLFKEIGVGAIFGKGITLRCPSRIALGKYVAIDDNGLLDASGVTSGITLGDNVIVSRNCVIQSKTAAVTIGIKTDIGCNTIISSSGGISIGNSVLIAGNCYIGGGRYIHARLDVPMMEQGVYTKGPVVIGDDVWIGAGAIVLDGVQIGKGCVVGAGAVVTKNLPDYAVAAGVPATIKKIRSEEDTANAIAQ